MATPYEGSRLLADWRAALPEERTQTKVAAELGCRQSIVSEWENGNRRPDLTNALALESLTGGIVPAESWQHDPEAIARMMDLAARRAARTAEVIEDLTPSTPPEVAA